MRCPRCNEETQDEWFCSHCGNQLTPRAAAAHVRQAAGSQGAMVWYGGSLAAIHLTAWVLLRRGIGLWPGVGVACAVAFLAGVLAGALRVMNPMDADALGEPLNQPSTLPGREVPILVLSVLLGVAGTPIGGLLFYLFFAYAKGRIDRRVVAIFGVVTVSAFVLSSASGWQHALLYSRTMLPAAMVGWAFSSLFRSDPW